MENISEIKPEPKKHPRVLALSLIIAITIVTNLFFNYSLSLIYSAPDYQNFCPDDVYNRVYDNKDMCIANGGLWSEQVAPVLESKSSAPVKTEVTGYCDARYLCQKKFNSASDVYNRNVFIVLVAIGVLMISLGTFIGISLLSVAFSWSGVLSIVIASMRYWGSAGSFARVLILAAVLGALIWLAIKKFAK